MKLSLADPCLGLELCPPLKDERPRPKLEFCDQLGLSWKFEARVPRK